MTGGDLGVIKFYDKDSREEDQGMKIHAGEIFITSVGTSTDGSFLAAGNNNGDLYIVKTGKKNKMANLKPHHKLLRHLSFIDNDSKIATGSDDSSIKIIDISS